MPKRIEHTIMIDERLANMRLDQALAQILTEYSRSKIQDWIKYGCVKVDGKEAKPRDKTIVGQEIKISAKLQEVIEDQPEAIKLNIVYEDEDILVVNKPAGLVVHPAAGNRTGTMLNALLHHAPTISQLPRAGIIHRLDKDTSGLLVVTKTLTAHTKLVKELQERKFTREYIAIVHGTMVAGGTIEAPIGRHPKDRKKMAVVLNGKPAITHYRVIEKFPNHTHIKVKLETGRTHQIRVHMAYIKHPLIGDPTYGNPRKQPHFHRQALHARKLGFIHPTKNTYMEWSAPIPPDIKELLTTLKTPLNIP
ncbi:MAG: 23S rRNA pseudouridine(1911/1915/1917) synthase RluD [Gammaproteobacteria bacterium]|nr:23S rRNA pseudouridine(1911/1915/1917) synthase RluD [Gammaproteobacteria bacterium]